MNETAPPPPSPPPVQEGPRVSGAELRDLGRLRRVHRGRTLAGVCGGLGRHFDVDPTIFRVLLVVLVFFGGAGLFLYVALWLLMPDEATDRAVLDLGDDVGKVLLVVVAVVAAVLVLGHGWGGWWFGPSLPIGLLVLVGVGFLIARDRRQQATPTATPSATSTSAPTSTGALTTETTPATSGAPAAPATPRWAPPVYTPPKRPRRSGPLLFWPTLAVVAVALGCLGVYDAGHHVATGAYWALAIAVVGAGLVVGAFRGRPGGLVLAGLVAVAGLVGSMVAGGIRSAQDLSYDPTQSVDVRSSYRLHTGRLDLNLSNLVDPAALDGRTVRVHGNTGEIEVVVPRGMRVVVSAVVHGPGGIDVTDRYTGGGLGTKADVTLDADSPTAPTLTLDADLRVGHIDVRHER